MLRLVIDVAIDNKSKVMIIRATFLLVRICGL